MVGEAATDVLTTASRLADEHLFPAAAATDAAEAVPVEQLDLLADAGLYGLAGPPEAGGQGADLAVACAVIEALAGGDLTTTFVWVQHHGLVRMLADEGAPAALRDTWLAPLCRGSRRAGLALAGLHPGTSRLSAVPAPSGDGWVLDGTSPWVTGWGRIDVLLLAARGPDDTVVWLVVDAAEQPGLSVARQRLVAVDASVTVELRLSAVAVPADRHIRTTPFDPGAWTGGGDLRINGSLALGVTGRCCRLLGPSRLDDELAACRAALDSSPPEEMAAARAAASALAVRAATTLVVTTGSRSILAGEHPQRLAREALFLLVFGSRPGIRASLLDLLR